MEWHPELPSIIKVVDKKTKENLKIKLNTKGMGIFHFGNAFEIVAGSYSNILHHVTWIMSLTYVVSNLRNK